MNRKCKTMPKTVGRDPVEVIDDFEWLRDRAAEQGWLSLHDEVVALLKRAQRDRRGPPAKHPRQVSLDRAFMSLAHRRFEELRATKSREEALHEASEYGAALDRRPKGRGKPGLTEAAIRDWLEHPGRHRKLSPFVLMAPTTGDNPPD